LSLQEIESEILLLAHRIGASGNLLPTFGFSEKSGRAHIEVNRCGYHYVIAARGHKAVRRTTADLNELLYIVFQSVTSTLAFNYEREHRFEMQDCRRIAFPLQIKLLSALSSEWARRCGQEHAEILRDYPLDDTETVRAKLVKELTDQGYTSDDAWRIAMKNYPRLRG
jgi:hypothetical protein